MSYVNNSAKSVHMELVSINFNPYSFKCILCYKIGFILQKTYKTEQQVLL